jgi:hypothetical protein
MARRDERKAAVEKKTQKRTYEKPSLRKHNPLKVSTGYNTIYYHYQY